VPQIIGDFRDLYPQNLRETTFAEVSKGIPPKAQGWREPTLGTNQTRKYPPTQSWRVLLAESRKDESASLPAIIKSDFDFAMLFLLCFPHRLCPALTKRFENQTSIFA
jgi:hypothetical protein